MPTKKSYKELLIKALLVLITPGGLILLAAYEINKRLKKNKEEQNDTNETREL